MSLVKSGQNNWRNRIYSQTYNPAASRDTSSTHALRHQLALGCSLVFGAGFFVTVTVQLGATNLRLGLTDLFLLVAGLVAAIDVIRTRQLPKLRMPFAYLWLALLTVWIGIALYIGHRFTETWQSWAVLNKGLGWFALVGYFFVGAYLRRISVQAGHAFIIGFVFAGTVSALVGYLSLVMETYELDGIVPSMAGQRIFAFMENPNAFGIALACAFATAAIYLAGPAPHRRIAILLCLSVMLLGIAFSASRSAWLGLLLAGAVAVVSTGLPWRRIVGSVAIAYALFLATFYGPACLPQPLTGIDRSYACEGWLASDHGGSGNNSGKSFGTDATSFLLQRRANLTSGVGVEERLESIRLGLAHWLEQPAMGIGLGSQLYLNEKQLGRSQIPHNSPAWVLTELGAIGFLLLGGFFVTAFFYIARPKLSELQGLPDRERLAFLACFLVLAAASIGTEVLYQRYLWFILGLALAIPRGHAEAPEAATPSRTERTVEMG